MKWHLMGAMAVLAAGMATAQTETLLVEDDVWKLYSNLDIQATDMADDFVLLGGVSAGGILNDTFYIGPVARINFDNIKLDGNPTVEIEEYNFWYAGIEAGFIFAPANILHFDVQATIGGGMLDYEVNPIEESGDWTFFLFEPAADVLINITDTWEIGAGVSYRFVTGDSETWFDESDISGIGARIFCRFHEF